MGQEPMLRWSGLPRTIDPTLKRHRWILGLALAAGAVASLVGWIDRDLAVVDGLQLGAAAGISAFLTWVLAREIDPDRPDSGLVGPVLVVPLLLALAVPSLLAGFWVVLMLRILNRSTGLPAKPLDSLGLVGLSAWLMASVHPAAGILAGLALMLDARLPGGHRYHRVLGAITLTLAAGYWLIRGGDLMLPRQPGLILAVGLAAGLYLLFIIQQGDPEAVADYSGQPLSARRVGAAQLAALILALVYFLLQGQAGLEAHSPLWAAMLGVAGFRWAERISG